MSANHDDADGVGRPPTGDPINPLPAAAEDDAGRPPEEGLHPPGGFFAPLRSWWDNVLTRIQSYRQRQHGDGQPPDTGGEMAGMVARVLAHTLLSATFWTAALMVLAFVVMAFYIYPTPQYWQGPAWLDWVGWTGIVLIVWGIIENREGSANRIGMVGLVLTFLFFLQGHINTRGDAVESGGVVAANGRWYAAMENGGDGKVVVGKGPEWVHTQYGYETPTTFQVVRKRGLQKILVRVIQVQVPESVPEGKVDALNASRRFREYDPAAIPSESYLAHSGVRWAAEGIPGDQIVCPPGWVLDQKTGNAVKQIR